MKGWIELCSDICWEDYHGMWARKARDGSWYVLQWTNMHDAAGESCGLDEFECQVKRLDLTRIPQKQLKSALQSCDFRQGPEGELISNYSGEQIEPAFAERAIVECCIQVGLGAPLESFTGNHYPLRVRAAARRYAMQCMRDADLLQERLERPVNAIYTTAENYGRGVLFTGDED